MVTVYRTKADDLDSGFLESVRAAFKGKEIEIVVTEQDETTFLLSTPTNRERLLAAVDDINEGRNLVRPDPSQFE